VLLRLLRGAGSRGLGGIRPRRGRVVRPLIDSTRADLRRDLERRGEPFCHDSSNENPAIPRNRIRQELVPVVRAIAPGGLRALARLASHAADDEAFLTSAAIEMLSTLVLREKTGGGERVGERRIAISAVGVAGLPAAISRRVVRQAAGEAAPGAALSSRHLDAVLDMTRADISRGHLDLPGLAVDRQGDALTLSVACPRPEARTVHGTASAFEVSEEERGLPLPGSVSLPEAGVTITAELAASPSGRRAVAGDGRTAMLQAASLTPPLVVRYWRKGDRFRPLGAPGRRKLQDLFVDRKVPRDARHLVPVVMDSAGRIVWVAGVAMAEECRVTAPEAGVVILELRKP